MVGYSGSSRTGDEQPRRDVALPTRLAKPDQTTDSSSHDLPHGALYTFSLEKASDMAMHGGALLTSSVER